MINRRETLKFTGAAALGLLTTNSGVASSNTSQPIINVGGYAYDRVQAIKDGKVSIDQLDIKFHESNIYDLNDLAFGQEQPHEITELGLIPYITKYINDDFRDYTLIPVFISRTFRHRNIYVHLDSGIETPQDLRGRKVGTPGYGSSANTWVRGMLQDQYDIAAEDMQWIEARKFSDVGTISASNGGGSRYQLPADFPLVQGPPGVDESDLLLNGDCDALITPITPRAFRERNPKIRQLFSSLKTTEQEYFRDTGIFPIMHVVAVRADMLEEMPRLANEIFRIYNEAKQAAYNNLEMTTVLRTSLPWVTEEYEETRKLMGDDYWRYGIESNRKELESIMRYTFEQGLVKRHLNFEELFHPSSLRL